MNIQDKHKQNCIEIKSGDFNKYFVNIKIGSGSFSDVYKSKINVGFAKLSEPDVIYEKINKLVPNDMEFTIKQLKYIKYKNHNNNKSHELNLIKFINEIDLLIKIEKLKYSCKYYGCLYDNNNMYIIMEYINGISLYDFIKDKKNMYAYDFIVKIITQLAEAIDELHKIGIIHNDIKIDNIMLVNNVYDINSNSQIKLIDYGLSCDLQNIKQRNCNLDTGTKKYMINNLNTKYKKSDEEYIEILKKKDWYAFGIVLFILLEKGYPISKDDTELLQLLENPILSDINYQKLYSLLKIILVDMKNNIVSDTPDTSYTSETIKKQIFEYIKTPTPSITLLSSLGEESTTENQTDVNGVGVSVSSKTLLKKSKSMKSRVSHWLTKTFRSSHTQKGGYKKTVKKYKYKIKYKN